MFGKQTRKVAYEARENAQLARQGLIDHTLECSTRYKSLMERGDERHKANLIRLEALELQFAALYKTARKIVFRLTWALVCGAGYLIYEALAWAIRDYGRMKGWWS